MDLRFSTNAGIGDIPLLHYGGNNSVRIFSRLCSQDELGVPVDILFVHCSTSDYANAILGGALAGDLLPRNEFFDFGRAIDDGNLGGD